MQKVRGHSEELPLFVGIRFQGLFHFPFGVLFTFPSRYLFTIGRQLVFSLTPWSAQIHTEFHVFRITQGHPRLLLVFKHRTFTFFGRAFQTLYSNVPDTISEPYNPGGKATGLGCSAFARHYLRNRIRFLFLRLLRCFTSPGSRVLPYIFREERIHINKYRLPHSEIPGS